jgi:hypothetical protein
MLDVAFTPSLRKNISGLIVQVRSLECPDLKGYLLLDNVDTLVAKPICARNKFQPSRFCLNHPPSHAYSKDCHGLIENLHWIRDRPDLLSSCTQVLQTVSQRKFEFSLAVIPSTESDICFDPRKGVLTITHLGHLAHQFISERPYALVSLDFSHKSRRITKNQCHQTTAITRSASAQKVEAYL